MAIRDYFGGDEDEDGLSGRGGWGEVRLFVVVFAVSENEEEASGGGGDGGGNGEAYPDASVGVVFGCGGFEGSDAGDALGVSVGRVGGGGWV